MSKAESIRYFNDCGCSAAEIALWIKCRLSYVRQALDERRAVRPVDPLNVAFCLWLQGR